MKKRWCWSILLSLLLFLIAVVGGWLRYSVHNEGLLQSITGDITKCLSAQAPAPAAGGAAGKRPVNNVVLKSYSRLDSDPASLNYKSIQTDGTDVVWQANGAEEWNFYIPETYDKDAKGALICNQSGKCITARHYKKDLDESLFLTEKTTVGYQDNTWQFRKLDKNKYSVCTNINLDNDATATKICLQPFKYTKRKRSGNVVYETVVAKNDADNPWDIEGLPDNFGALLTG
jgi:hypothetical protein